MNLAWVMVEPGRQMSELSAGTFGKVRPTVRVAPDIYLDAGYGTRWVVVISGYKPDPTSVIRQSR